MRCTNDIKSKIKLTLCNHRNNYLDIISSEIRQEKAKIAGWRQARLDVLKDSVAPLVKEWAKKNKRDYSNYRWEQDISSQELTDKILKRFFYENSYSNRFPEVYTEKLHKLSNIESKFRSKAELIIFDTFIRVVSVKSLDELEDLIEEGKKEITQAYENRGNL